MATKLSQEDILTAIDGMTVLELSEFIKAFEERYGVTAAAPAAVAVAAAPARRELARVVRAVGPEDGAAARPLPAPEVADIAGAAVRVGGFEGE